MSRVRIALLRIAWVMLGVPAVGFAQTWSGGGADNSLSTAGNWVGGVTPNFSGAEASTNTTSLIFSNAVQTTVNIGTSTRRGVSNIAFVGPNVGAFNFTNTGRWVLSYGGKISMDADVANSIQLGRIGFGTNNVVGGSFTLENNATLATATMLSSVSFTTANSNNTSTMILTGSNTGANRFDSASGNLALIKNGTGRWDLSGSSFTGNATINSGTVGLAGNNALGAGMITINGGTIGSVTSGRSLNNNIVVGGDFQLGGLGQSTTLSGNVDLGGATRTITMGNSATVSGTISNGNLAIKDGTLNLSTTGLIHSNTAFSLVGTNSAATLSISGLTATGLTVNNFSATTNTTITLGAKSLTVGGDGSSTTNRATITGAGSLIKEGNGTMTLGSSSSTYSGGTSLNGGAIAIASDNAFGTGLLTIAAGTRIGSYATQARTITNAVAVNGDFTVGGFNNGTTFNGSMNLGGATRTITLDNSATIGGSITNGGLTVASSLGRTLTLSGSNSYSGGTTVSSGTLLVNNTTGSGTGSGGVSVSSGATLGGSGTIAGATAISGTLSPGNSPGVLSFGSDLSLNSGGNMIWELWGNTEVNSPLLYDQVVVGGNLSVLGSFGVTLDFGTLAGGSTVNWNDTFWDSQRSWVLFDVAGTSSGVSSLSLLNTNFNDANNADLSSARSGASFSIAQVGSDVVVNYIPEPSTGSLIALGGCALVGLRAFRRRCA